MFYLQGKKVTGSDVEKSEITDDLEKLGIRVKIGHKAENIEKDAEAIIYTVAILEDNPELAKARKRKIVCVTYPQALGELSKQMYTIAIAGTHGKTTTTAMIGHILKKAGFDPTVIVGSKMLSDSEKSGGNFLAGKSKYLVVEACEYKRSFLNLHPKILVITNIEAEHLDYYKDLDDIKSAFKELENKVPKDGHVIKESDYKKIKTDFELLIPGQHNIWNAQAAIKTAEVLGIPNEKAKEYLKDFRGTWRRLEYKGEKDGNIFYDDYAHHPTEIRASLSALRQKHPDKNLVCVFMPHTQSRTKLLFDDFVKELGVADKIFITPIYITRESPDDSISNKILSDAINKSAGQTSLSLPVENPTKLREKLSQIKTAKPLCVVMMGAGSIYEWTKEILNK